MDEPRVGQVVAGDEDFADGDRAPEHALAHLELEGP